MTTYIYKTTGVIFVIMLCSTTLFHAASLQVSAPVRLDSKGVEQACPCQKCTDIGIQGKQHPYTEYEKCLAHAAIYLASILHNDVRNLVIEYAVDRDREWIPLRGSLGGTFTIPTNEDAFNENKKVVHCASINHHVAGVGMPRMLVKRFMHKEILFKKDDISELAKFFQKPKQSPCTVHSICDRYKIEAKKNDLKGEVCIQMSYLLNTIKRLPGCIEDQKKDTLSCTVL